MQVLKKFSLFVIALSLAACSTSKKDIVLEQSGINDFNSDISEINISDESSFRVAMLLPLTGATAKHGQGLKNASMLALEDIKNPKMILQYYDTQSTPSGARIAAENAIRQGAKVIIGPLMSSEVHAIAEETIYRGVPVIAFSTAQEVLQPGIYTMGLLMDEQVNRIISFAAENGRKRLALLIPDSSTGIAVARAATKAAQKNNVEVTVIGFYPTDISDFSTIIKQMTNYEKRHAEVLRLKTELEIKASTGDASAAYELKKLSTKEGIGDVGFDMILIPETGAKLTSAISMFAYYDAAYPDVQFLGTSIWEAGKFNNESAMHKSWFPAISRAYSGYFANKYFQTFGEKPSSLYSFSYDAIALANNLSEKTDDKFNTAITSANGYKGINGAFKFFEDGSNQHSMDIVEIMPSANVIISSANNNLADISSSKLDAVNTSENFVAPKIFGKDIQSAQIAIYGALLPENNNSTNME